MELISLDETLVNADWAKVAWSLPPYRSRAFFGLVPPDTLTQFKKTPAYLAAVEEGWIDSNDEWTDTWAPVDTSTEYDKPGVKNNAAETHIDYAQLGRRFDTLEADGIKQLRPMLVMVRDALQAKIRRSKDAHDLVRSLQFPYQGSITAAISTMLTRAWQAGAEDAVHEAKTGARIVKLAYNPGQARDTHGKWTSMDSPIPSTKGADIREALSNVYSNVVEAYAKKETVDINALTSRQRTVGKERVDEYIRNPKRAADVARGRSGNSLLVVRRSGQMAIVDGNHRVAAALARGEKTIKAKVVDMDRAFSDAKKIAKPGEGIGLTLMNAADKLLGKKAKYTQISDVTMYAFDPAPRTLYVRRDVLNAADIIKWAKGEGFETTLQSEDMHVTIVYSRALVDWNVVGRRGDDFHSWGGDRKVMALGDGGAIVLQLDEKELNARWQEFIAAGCSWDYPEYHPHITLTYDKPAALDLAMVKPYSGDIKLGPEKFEALDLDWADGVEENALRMFAGKPSSFTPRSAISWVKSQAMVVAGILADHILSDVKLEIMNGLKTGKTMNEIASGIVAVFLPYIGELGAEALQQLSPWRLETIVRTNNTTAYNHGRLTEFVKPEMLPFLKGIRYSAVLDERTTPCCAFLDQKIFDPSSPDLESLLPPNHYNCRSVIVPIVVGETVDPKDFITLAEIGEAKSLAQAKFI